MSAHQVAVIRRRLSIGLPAYSGEYYVAEAILNSSAPRGCQCLVRRFPSTYVSGPGRRDSPESK